MNFFKTVFPADDDDDAATDAAEEPPSPAGAWSFGGLLKTIATKSETFVDTYRRDLEEFGAGLKKETAVFAGAIKDLPGSLEAGASAAQTGLESVGQAIDDIGVSVWQGTADIIAHSKEAILAAAADDSDDADGFGSDSRNGGLGFDPGAKYSRFEAMVYSIQSDPATYLDEPEDGEEFDVWRKSVSLEEKDEEIGNLAGLDGSMEGVYNKLVPKMVDHETFWYRYFYKVYKLKQVEDARANLVKRAISGEDDEELSWEVEDEEEQRHSDKKDVKETELVAKEIAATGDEVVEDKERVTDEAEKEIVTNVGDVSVLSNQNEVKSVALDSKSAEEEDLGWDEIEDVGSSDEKKGSSTSVSPSKEELRKRLNVAEDDDDDDLSWDIEDDEPLNQ